MLTKKLSHQTCLAEKPAEKQKKLHAENGLYLLIYPDGSKSWRHRITVNGRDTTLSYGPFGPAPKTTLKVAREKRDETLHQLRHGIDPVAQKRAEKQSKTDSFEAIAREWLDAGCPPNKKGRPIESATVKQLQRRLENYVFPRHGRVPINDISASDLHRTLRHIVSDGTIETAHRVRSVTSRVFRYAVVTGRADRDPAADLRDALPSVATKSFAAITDPVEIGALLRAIDKYDGRPETLAALKLAPLVFVRPSELRGAEWTEIDMDKAEWTIPGARMKMSRDHWVPLASQAVAILDDLYKHTGNGSLVFPGIRSRKRPISENTLNE